MTETFAITAPWLSAPETQAVFASLERGGFQARAVGGIVRNTLLGLPQTDIDIATNALPAQTIQLARAAGLKTIPTGLSHGTVTVIANGTSFEVTTLRRDVNTDGRHAEVAFTDDWALDAARRDFTINALYCDRHGTFFDPLGGAGDLSPVRIRFIGDPFARIGEDYLRILRFFRFSATYSAGGSLDDAGLKAAAALRGGVRQISGERIQSELFKLLVAPFSLSVTTALVTHGVLDAIVPLTPNLRVFSRLIALETLFNLPAHPVRRLAALAVTSLDDAQALAQRLKLSTRDRTMIADAARHIGLITPHMGLPAAKAVAYQLGISAFTHGVVMSWARADWPLDDQALFHLATLEREWQPPMLPVTGSDALAIGIPPGPAVGRAIKALEAHWIETGFTRSRDDLLLELKRRAFECTPPH